MHGHPQVLSPNMIDPEIQQHYELGLERDRLQDSSPIEFARTTEILQRLLPPLLPGSWMWAAPPDATRYGWRLGDMRFTSSIRWLSISNKRQKPATLQTTLSRST
jgi:hypothetical protein